MPRHHRSKELRTLLGSGKEFEHIHFIWLPPYAPDYNPQEHVWKVAKLATKKHSHRYIRGIEAGV